VTARDWPRSRKAPGQQSGRRADAGHLPALAVTTRLENSLVMGLAMIFVCVGSSFMLSLLRKTIPRRIRLIASVAIIATFVILIDQFLQAFYWEMSRQLGPYVGLIITNCIVLGRAEAFAMQNKPQLAVVDALAAGIGFAASWPSWAFSGNCWARARCSAFTMLDPQWYTKNQVMVLAPGAFVVMGFLIAFFNWLQAEGRRKGLTDAGNTVTICDHPDGRADEQHPAGKVPGDVFVPELLEADQHGLGTGRGGDFRHDGHDHGQSLRLSLLARSAGNSAFDD
jgi:Na+-transporting NADH:ubiquinone oxidoreductase subunit D